MIACLIVASVLSAPPPPSVDVDRILAAIQHVETGNQTMPDHAVGDGGKALGRYQIWRVYWIDACDYDHTLASRPYDDVRDPVYARRVVIAYLSRYCKTWTIDECARLHNGGPNGPRRRSTDGYTAKVAARYTVVKESSAKS